MKTPNPMLLAVTAATLSGLGCAQAPVAPAPVPQPEPVPQLSLPMPEPAPVVQPPQQAPQQSSSRSEWQLAPSRGTWQEVPSLSDWQPTNSQTNGFQATTGRYGGSMGFQGGANLRSWPDTGMHREVWSQLLGPTPTQTTQGSWANSTNRTYSNDGAR